MTIIEAHGFLKDKILILHYFHIELRMFIVVRQIDGGTVLDDPLGFTRDLLRVSLQILCLAGPTEMR